MQNPHTRHGYCSRAVPDATYLSTASPFHISPRAYNANYLLRPTGGNYLVPPRAYETGFISPYVNTIRTESGFTDCCNTLANNCECSPITNYTPGTGLPDAFNGYQSSCPCYPITLPGPDYGPVNDVPWMVPFVSDTGLEYIVNPSLVNIQPP